ncbi:MAG: zinc ABC transporter substrate-binding protein [Rhodomicrobium sp.]
MQNRAVSIVAVAGLVILAVLEAWAAEPVSVVAAENFYGDVAQQIGGNTVKVMSILSNPGQDPHLFEASPGVARSLSKAQIVIYNGIDYDPWMPKLLKGAKSPGRKEIVVADLVGKKTGDNSHIWYDPDTMLVLASTLSEALATADPANKAQYEERLAAFRISIKLIEDKITELKGRLEGTPVTATEPVFGYMFQALGMDVRNKQFQLATMNSTEPGASDVAAFESDLKGHKVKLLVYNSQASSALAGRILELAKENNIPVVGIEETEPPGKTYQTWVMGRLEAVGKALPKLTQ